MYVIKSQKPRASQSWRSGSAEISLSIGAMPACNSKFNHLCNLSLVLGQLFGSFGAFPIPIACTSEVRNDSCTHVINTAGCAFSARVADSITSTIVFFSFFRLICVKLAKCAKFDSVCFYFGCLVSCPVFPVCGDSAGSVDIVTLNYKVKAHEYLQDDRFGRSVSISGNYAIIGADGDSTAFFFERDTDSGRWNEIQKIISSDYIQTDPFFESSFGYSVAISGNYAIVGDHKIEESTGAAYIFEKTTSLIYTANGSWVEVAKLTSDTIEFGCSVDLDGDYAIVGACGAGESSGSAYIYQRINSEWTLLKICTPFDAMEDFEIEADTHDVGDNFGWSVSISGSTALIGAMNDDDLGYKTGSVYVYQLTDGLDGTWNFKSKLVANDGSKGDCFGGSVSLYGDLAIIGASGGCEVTNVFYGGVQKGRACIFQCIANVSDTSDGSEEFDESDVSDVSWVQTAQVFPYDSFKGDFFGREVSINEEWAIVSGATGVYVFARESRAWNETDETSEWIEMMKLRNTDYGTSGCFGCSLEISQDNTMLIGAWSNDAAYFFNPDSTFGPTTDPTLRPTVEPTLSILSEGESIDSIAEEIIALIFIIVGSTFAVFIGIFVLYRRCCRKANRTRELTLDEEGYMK